jgi:hypothetical protein
MIKRDDIEKYVNLTKIEFAEFIEFDFFIFFTTKLDATNSTDLSIDEQRDLAILREDYKKKMRKYKKQIDALKKVIATRTPYFYTRTPYFLYTYTLAY